MRGEREWSNGSVRGVHGKGLAQGWGPGHARSLSQGCRAQGTRGAHRCRSLRVHGRTEGSGAVVPTRWVGR